MSWLLALLACGRGPELETRPLEPGTTPPSDEDLVVDFGDTPAAPSDLRVTISGTSARCEGPDQVWLGVETVGEPVAITATPWHDGEAGTPIELPVPGGESAFRLATLEAPVERCDEATWHWQAHDANGSHCKVTGPDADQVLALVSEPCSE